MKRYLFVFNVCIFSLCIVSCDPETTPEDDTGDTKGSIIATLDAGNGEYVGKTLHLDVYPKNADISAAGTCLAGAYPTIVDSGMSFKVEKDGETWYGQPDQSYDLYAMIDMDDSSPFAGPVSGEDMFYTMAPMVVATTEDKTVPLLRGDFMLWGSVFVKVTGLPSNYEGEDFIVAIATDDQFDLADVVAGSRRTVGAGGTVVHNQMYTFGGTDFTADSWLDKGTYYLTGFIDLNKNRDWDEIEPILLTRIFLKSDDDWLIALKLKYPDDFS